MTKYGPRPTMPPPNPVPCSSPGCQYTTPEGLPDFTILTEHLTLHSRLAHPIQQGAHAAPVAAGLTAKLDKRLRPQATLGMSELDWRFYVSEWSRYTRQTGISDRVLLDELWNTMDTELRQLAFSEGGEDQLTTEVLMLEKIKSLAVTVLHPSVHIVTLHDMKQLPSETVKSFSARVRGTAANCNLSKKCPCATPQNVSYQDETCFNVVLSGLHDQDMKDRALTQAMLGTVKDLPTLATYCTAEESGKCLSTVAGVRSSYKKGDEVRNIPEKCGFCGQKTHGGGTRADREKMCKAWGKQCTQCSKLHHLAKVCRSGSKQDGAKAEAGGTNAAFGFFSITSHTIWRPWECITTQPSFLPQCPPPSLQSPQPGTWSFPPPSSEDVPVWQPGVPTSNRFALLEEEDCVMEEEAVHFPQTAPSPPKKCCKPVLSSKAEDTPLPLLTETFQFDMVPTTVAHLTSMAAHLSQSDCGPVRTLPLPHMVHDIIRGWTPARPHSSPSYQLDLILCRPAYAAIGLTLPIKRNTSTRHIRRSSIFDTGAQMNVVPARILAMMGISLDLIFPVRSHIGGPSSEPITIIGGVILTITGTNPLTHTSHSTDQLFYVSSTVQHIYLSLEACIALGAVPPNFPQVGAFPAEPAAVAGSITTQASEGTPAPSLPPCSNSGTVLPGDPPCSCPARNLPPTTRPALPCDPTAANLPRLKQYILDRFASSAFNMCERQKLPLLNDSPPIRLHVDPEAQPYAAHKPAQVALHWRDAVKAGLDRDKRLGVIRRVALNEPTIW